MGPHAGEAVGLELEPDRQLVGRRWIGFLQLSNPSIRPEQMLDVVPQLVGKHVGLGEIARRAKALLELVEKAQIEVDSLVNRTIERPHCRLCRTAAGVGGVAKQYEARWRESGAVAGENLGPRSLNIVENEGDELDLGLLGCGISAGERRGGCGNARLHPDVIEQIAAKQQAECKHDHSAAEAEPLGHPTAAKGAPIVEIWTASAGCPTHQLTSGRVGIPESSKGKKPAATLLGYEDRCTTPIDFGEGLCDGWVEVAAGAPADLGECLVDSPGGAVRTLVGERVEEVGKRDDARLHGDALARDAIRIPGAVPPLVMAASNALREPNELRSSLGKHPRADHRMLLHDLEFFRRQRAGLEQNAVRNSNLADIMQWGGAPNQLDGRAFDSNRLRQPGRDFRHSARVIARVVVAEFDRRRQSLKNFEL